MAAVAFTKARLRATTRSNSQPLTQKYRPCSLSMNGCGGGSDKPVGVCEARTLPAVSMTDSAVSQLNSAILALSADPPRSSSGIIRLEVPVKQRVSAIDWLHAHQHLPRCYFSGRAGHMAEPSLSWSNGGASKNTKSENVIGVAGVGSAVYFQRFDPFSLQDWRCIKRFLSKDCPLIRAYGTIRFDARTNVSLEWKDFGSFYFMVPQRY